MDTAMDTPGIIILSLMEVSKIISGLALKNISGGNTPSNGYVVDQRIYTKSPRKKACDIRLVITNFFMFLR